MDEADPQLAEPSRCQGERNRPAGELQGAGVGGVEARQDLDQSGLPGAVLPEQAMDLSAPDGQGDIGQGMDAAELLADSAQRQRGRPFGRPRVGWGWRYFSPQSVAYSSR